MITRIGALGFTAGLPGPWGALLAAAADLQARVDALAAFSATVDFGSLQAGIVLAGQISAALSAAIAAGITPPSISAQFAIVAGLVAALQAQLTLIMNMLNLSATMQVYAYDGRVDQFGPELGAELSGGFPGGSGADHCNGIVLAATESASWAAMSQVFKVTP